MTDKTNWQNKAPPLFKDQPMPRAIEYYEQVQLRDQELILEQKEEISKLKGKVNQLRMQLESHTDRRILNYR